MPDQDDDFNRTMADLGAKILDLNQSFQQHNPSMLFVNVPKFSGNSDENPQEFLSKYQTFTAAYPEKTKCQGMNIALTDSAYRWLRGNLKKECDDGDWVVVKQQFKERFYPRNPRLAHIQRLREMQYEPRGKQS